jgi:hypothetical protein
MTAGQPPPLPVRPVPHHGETAGSYLRRLAAANYLRFSYLRRYLARPEGSYWPSTPAGSQPLSAAICLRSVAPSPKLTLARLASCAECTLPASEGQTAFGVMLPGDQVRAGPLVCLAHRAWAVPG